MRRMRMGSRLTMDWRRRRKRRRRSCSVSIL